MAFNAWETYKCMVSEAYQLIGEGPVDPMSEKWVEAIATVGGWAGLQSGGYLEAVISQIPGGRDAVIQKVVSVGYKQGTTPSEVADKLLNLYNGTRCAPQPTTTDDIAMAAQAKSTAGRVVQQEVVAKPSTEISAAMLAALRSSSIAQREAGAYAQTQSFSVRPGNVSFVPPPPNPRASVNVDANGNPIAPVPSAGKNTALLLGAAAIAALLFLR